MKTSVKKRKSRPIKAEVKAGKTNHAYNFIKRSALFILALGILSFNLLVKIDVSAENNSEAVTLENLLQAHNEYRKSEGVAELKLNNLLNISSNKKGVVMLDNQCWSHYCPPGKSPWDFFDDASYDYIYAGENLAEGYYSIDSLMQAWINSKTHRDNIIKPEFTEVGFSILYGNYLNNSNNILVVAHFGTTPNGPSVASAENPSITITSPANNFVSSEEFLDVAGTVTGLDNVRVFVNNALDGTADISGGVFTHRIQKLNNGNNIVWADGSNSVTTLESNKVNVEHTSLTTLDNKYELVNSSEEGFEISATNKNMVNLVFIGFLALVFLIDIILVSRSRAITSTKSFSHYHLALVGLVALVILIGGFAGQIQNGISV